MDTQQISDLFMIFNVSGDGSMSKQEFVYCWNGWIKKVCHHRRMILKRNTNKTYFFLKQKHKVTALPLIFFDKAAVVLYSCTVALVKISGKSLS